MKKSGVKVQHIQIITVPKYITEDGEIYLYLVPVKKRIFPRLRQKICQGFRWLWDQTKQIGYSFVGIKVHRVVSRWLLVASVTAITGICAIADAYRVRGYWAVGGEYLLIIMVFYFMFHITKLLEV